MIAKDYKQNKKQVLNLKILETFGYDIELTYVKKDEGTQYVHVL